MAEIYNWDKSLREYKSTKNTQNPSFSSTLLDEIYRSIDGGEEKFGQFKLQKEKVEKKQSVRAAGAGVGDCGRRRVKSSSAVEDEEITNFQRPCLVEKWMEMKANEKALMGRRGQATLPEFDRKMSLDNYPLFFSSGSSSSDSSFGWFSEAETTKSKSTCFGPFNMPKQVKTSVSPRSVFKKHNEFCNETTDHSGLIRSKSRALKIYTSLKKVKQPISPGGRLTTFLNSIFTNGNVKKSKDSSQTGFEDRTRTNRNSKSTNVSTCSSASSFSRTCLSKNSSSSRDKLNNGVPRTVRFYPVSVIVDEDSCLCSEKIICNERGFGKCAPTLPSRRTEKSNLEEFFRRYDDRKEDFDGDENDMASDSSSDLFELDHLAVFKNDKYCEELPVYETTHLGTNRAIASGLIC